MTRPELFRVKNAMLIANLISNVIGVSVVFFINRMSATPAMSELQQLANLVSMFFLPCAFLIPTAITLIYERPIRSLLNRKYLQKPLSDEAIEEARRKLLNEPFFLIAIDFGIWLTSAFLYSSIFHIVGGGRAIVQETFFNSLFTGLITTTIAFFVFEMVLQRRVVHYFFPNGGLYATPKTLHIRISTRLFALLFACNLIPFIAIVGATMDTFHTTLSPPQIVENLQLIILSNSIIFMAVGIWVTFLVSTNLTKPLHEIIHVLRGIRKGHFDDKVKVSSNDEIGYAGDVINEMTVGLKERDFIKETFGKYVSEEIRDEILAGNISFDGELRKVTVLFADLRNFTPLVEQTPPKEVVKIINGYFKEMDEAITDHKGLVLQFIGDEIMAVFGAPVSRDDHEIHAVEAALEMKKRLNTVNRDLQEHGIEPLAHGIGIHTGEVVAANIGSPDRLSYALVGDTVNTASRLQGLNKEFGTEIIISNTTRAGINGDFSIRELPAATVKGKRAPVQVFALA